jgi:N-acetylmuramoyl-L-alanine amidase
MTAGEGTPALERSDAVVRSALRKRNTKESPVLPELVCLALAVYHEARSEPFDGQVAVAEVVMNRAASARYPDNICDVVTQGGTVRNRCQFSYYCDGKPETPHNRRAWRRSVAIAKLMQNGVISGNVRDATHYHAVYAKPYWRAHFHRVALIGRHVFYSPDEPSSEAAAAVAGASVGGQAIVAANL